MAAYPYRYAWGPRIKGWPESSPLKQLDRKGSRCRIVAPPAGKKAGMNSALVEFEDGFVAVISRNALRKAVA